MSKRQGSMTPDIPISSWEFFSLSRDILGSGAFWRIFGVEKSQVSRWAVNPHAAGDSQRNPLDRLGDLFHKMVEAGETEACRTQIAELAKIVGMELATPDADCQPEGKPIQDELLDIPPAIVEHCQSIRRRDPIQTVESCERAAIREIRQATAAYKEEVAR